MTPDFEFNYIRVREYFQEWREHNSAQPSVWLFICPADTKDWWKDTTYWLLVTLNKEPDLMEYYLSIPNRDYSVYNNEDEVSPHWKFIRDYMAENSRFEAYRVKRTFDIIIQWVKVFETISRMEVYPPAPFRFDIELIERYEEERKKQPGMLEKMGLTYADVGIPVNDPGWQHSENALWLADHLNRRPFLMQAYFDAKQEIHEKGNPPWEDPFCSTAYLKLYYFVLGHLDGEIYQLLFHYMIRTLEHYEKISRGEINE